MEKPAVFIASSVEGLGIADAINVNLDHDVHCTVWRNGTFKVGSDGLSSLITKSSVVDFAVFVFTPDDITTMRDEKMAVARDNVVFELGLFIGAAGMDRCYVIKPRGVEMHLPSDIAGITTVDYVANRPDGDTASAVNAACTKIKARIKELGMLSRSPAKAEGAPRQHIPNPPDYKLSAVDLEFLAQCVRSHVAFPTGLSYNWVSSHITAPEYQIALAAVKLMRLGYIEKSVEIGEHDEEYFSYRATEDGLDMFLKHEEQYAALQAAAAEDRQRANGYGTTRRRSPAPAPTAAPAATPKSSSGFDDMDDDIPF